MKLRLLRYLFSCVLLMLSAVTFFSCNNSDDDTDYVCVKPQSEYYFEPVAVSDTLYIESSGRWAVSGMPAWIKADPSSGNNGDKLIIAVSENPSPDERCAVLTVMCGSATATVNITQYYNACNDANHVHAIDLGLSVKWACCNVGATKPEEYGGYYAWGETEEKSYYDWDTYKWCNGTYNSLTKYCTASDYGRVDNKTVLDPEDDVAHVKWGGSWRMPTSSEIKELNDNCTWQWTTLNGVNGYRVTGPNGNSIFLPAAGYRYGAELDFRGSNGGYWSSSLAVNSCYRAYDLGFGDDYRYWYNDVYRDSGHCVRPVSM